MRHNGLTRPYAPLQVATWLTLPILVIQFLLFVSPILPIAASIPCTLLYIALAVASTCYAYMACVIDPMDPLLAHELTNVSTDPPRCKSCLPIPKMQRDSNNDETKQCWVCEVQVHEHAMHCKYCDKCVAHFDHHCQWLNTCIGQANYPYFFVTLWCLTGMLLVHLAIMIYLAVDILTKGDSRDRADEDWIANNASIVVAVVLIVFSVAVGCILSLVAQLLWFHIGLKKEGLTTYQYIVKDSAKKRELSKQKSTLKQKRIMAISRAKAQGKTWLAWKLAIGEFVPCCDEMKQEATLTSNRSNNSNTDEERPPPPEARTTTITNGTGSGNIDHANGLIAANQEDETKQPES